MRYIVVAVLLVIGVPQVLHADLFMRVVDTGAGLCCIIRTPSDEYIIYDFGHWNGTGYRAYMGVKDVVPLGEPIALAVISHSDSDHAGGAKRVFDEYQVNKIVRPNVDRDTSTWTSTIQAIADEPNCEDINIENDSLSDPIMLGDTKVTFVAGWKGCQSAGEAGAVAELALDVAAQAVEYGVPAVLEKVDGQSSIRAGVAMDEAACLTARRQQAMAMLGRPVKELIRVITGIAQQVAAVVESFDELPGHGLFADVHRRDDPSDRQGRLRPDRMQLVAFRQAAGAAPPARIGILAIAAHGQRLAIDGFDEIRRLGRRGERFQPRFQQLQQPLHGLAPQATTHGGLRGKALTLQQVGRPMLGLTGPTHRSIMHDGPQPHADNTRGAETISIAPAMA